MATKRRSRRPAPPKSEIPAQRVMRRDRVRLSRERDDAKREHAIEISAEMREQRKLALSGLDLKPAPRLPISEQAQNLLELLDAHQVIVLAGETGSGKTTQLPKLCLQLGLGVGGMIGHTQPRRLAARTVAKRIAEEVGAELGAQVGYAVRFSDQVADTTLLKVMTDGLLLTEIRRDRYLDAYDAIIIDEAHERSLNIDFLLGYLKRLLVRRKDLKVIITSATIDVDRFAEFFGGVPIVHVSGRTFPVEVQYRDTLDEQDPLTGVIDALQEIDAAPLGPARDVLVFFSGEREIFEAARALRKSFAERFEVLPLYARLSFAEQRRIFAPSGARRRVVLATNVAETSLTVPNIGFVIDPGYARINRYSYRSKLQRLPIEPISQASADQRKGRCGRVAPGVCFRLYSEQDLLGRQEYTDAEIHRVNLASVVLQMQAFRLGDIATFPFLDPPDPRAIKDAVRLLEELRALEKGRLSDTGRAMARMPVDPRLARMLVEANRQGALAELLVIVSALAVADPRERPLAKAQAADESHASFAHDKSDFLGLLKMWRYLEQQRQSLTRSRFDTVLKKRYLNRQRVREWREIHRQLLLVCRDMGYRLNGNAAGYRAVHESILAGSLSLIAHHDERGHYFGARNLKLRLFPGSVLAGRTPKWVVAGEIAETSRVYARQVAFVEPSWIERQAEHLVKSQYSEPFWSAKRGEALAYKSVSLYGLRLADKRQVSFAGIDVDRSRDLFIRHGLVAGQVNEPPPFLLHNLHEMARVEDLEAKGRRRDLLVSDDDLYAFYAQRLPATIARVSDLRKWLRGAHRERVESLFMAPDMLLVKQAGLLAENDFPPHLVIGDLSLGLRYRFAPGEVDDGVTITVPAGVLAAVGGELLEWSVPGMLPMLVEQWLRSLPKHKRRELVPLPDTVDELATSLLRPEVYRSGRLLTCLSDLLKQRFRLLVGHTDWDRDRIDNHLLMYVRVVDEHGAQLAAGRDIKALKSQLAALDANVAHESSEESYNLQDLSEFPDRTINAHEILGDARNALIKYPGLVERDDRIDLVLFDAEAERDDAHRAGLAALALRRLGSTGSYFRKALDKHPQLGLHFASLGNAQQLKAQLLKNVVWYCFFEGESLPVTAEQFEQRMTGARAKLGDVFDAFVGQFAETMALRFACVTALEKLQSVAYEPCKQDILCQLNELAPMNVLESTPSQYVRLLPRYLNGALWRIQRLPGHVPKDIRLINEIQPLYERLRHVQQAELADAQRCSALRFYLEELRLMLFAEPIARQKAADHPLNTSFLGARWKPSFKRVAAQILAEEKRIGLA